MAQYDIEDFKRYEARLEALEATWFTEEEQEINRLMIRVVRSIRSTLWLINSSVKYFAAPIGILVAGWAYGENILEWIAHVLSGAGK